MKDKHSFSSYFVIFLLLSLAVFGLSKIGVLKPIEPIFQVVFSPIEAVFYKSFSFVTGIGGNPKIKQLQNENLQLSKKLVNQDKLIQDNKALRDQFEILNPKSTNLIPADVIGAPGFLPGVTVPENYTIDKGENDGIKIGDAVIYKDNLVGKVSKTTKYLSSVILITNSNSSFTAKTLEKNALGVVKGQGGGDLILDNVVLSDDLKQGDVVVSRGDVGIKGSGFLPDLIVGKIVSVSKNPSDLFQKAKIQSLVNFSGIDKVFVLSL